MGDKNIADKLSKEFELFERPDSELTEKDVVYFFAEVRKKLDHKNKKDSNKFPNLSFFADWILHTHKDHVHEHIKGMILKSNDNHKSFIEMQFLKKEMGKFFKEENLSQIITDNYWVPFKRKLIDILSEQPLILKDTVAKFEFYPDTGDGQIKYKFIRSNNL